MEEDKARSEATFRHTVKNISEIKGSTYSSEFYARNLPWKIIVRLVKKGEEKFLGFYLQCNKDNRSISWSCYAVAELCLLSCKKEQQLASFSRKIQHLFCSKESDWGFTYFITLQDVLDPDKKFIEDDDSITLEVHMVADAPYGVISWDMKKQADYIELKNQDATCYMNSLLQMLSFTNQLQKTEYEMPMKSDDSSKSVALVLQRISHKLLFSDKPVDTKKLTKSFGWETLDSIIQNDVQPFLRVLMERLQEKRLEEIRSEEVNLCMTVNVVLEDSFYAHQGNNIYDLKHALYRVFRVRKQATVHDFLELLSDSLKYPVEQIRIWSFFQRSNQTCRLVFIDPDADFQETIIDYAENHNTWNVFVELPPDSGMMAFPPYDKDNDVLLFFKLYDPRNKKIHYCGHHCMPITAKVQNLIPILNKRAGFLPDTNLALYEEIKPNLFENIDNLTVPLQNVLEEFVDGNIIVFQKKGNDM